MPLPHFIIAGGRRCGTTSLYHWVKNHPEIHMYPETDTAYFIDNELVGRTEWLDGKVDPEAWNKTHSVEDYASKFKPPHQDLVIGEKSADLLFWKQSHPRLAEYLPHCKFIIQLRNPISRAYSHYWNDFGKGRESLSFEEALSVEDDRSQGSDYARHHLSYKERGCYDESLKSFFQHLPRENVLVLIMEETLEDPKLLN